MNVPGVLSPIVTVLNWPVSRFRDIGRTYDVALPPSDARAIVRGAIGTDPMYLPVTEGIAASRRADIAGRVDDDGRLEIHIGGKREIALAAMLAGGWTLNLTSSASLARDHELPAIFERLEQVLRPHLRPPPPRG